MRRNLLIWRDLVIFGVIAIILGTAIANAWKRPAEKDFVILHICDSTGIERSTKLEMSPNTLEGQIATELETLFRNSPHPTELGSYWWELQWPTTESNRKNGDVVSVKFTTRSATVNVRVTADSRSPFELWQKPIEIPFRSSQTIGELKEYAAAVIAKDVVNFAKVRPTVLTSLTAPN